MKNLLTIAVATIALAAFATTTFAGKCCSDGDKSKENCKDKEKTEQGSPS